MNGDFLDRLERRLGFLATPGLPAFVAGMTALVGILGLLKPEFSDALALDPLLVRRGQLWRALTFLVVPPPAGALWLLLWVAMLYACLQALEHAWGDLKFTMFLATGVLATAAGALAVGEPFGNSLIILAAFLAFARLMPDREILVMFVLPVKLRWLAALAALWVAVQFAAGGLAGRVEIAAGLAPYLLFFGPDHWREIKRGWRSHLGGR